jgi:hypothetical protein
MNQQPRNATTNIKAKIRQSLTRYYSAKITLNLYSLVLEDGHLNGGNCAPFEMYVLKIW